MKLNLHLTNKLVTPEEEDEARYPWAFNKKTKWTDRMIKRAIIWLSERVGKPVLKLTALDYEKNNLRELLEKFGKAELANLFIFNELQHTITGWPGGKPNADDTQRPERATPYPKRVAVFAPHPDDDVISMGGTVRRLVQQGHDVHICYETSGNIAVGDEEVRRFMHFVNGFNQLFADSKDEVVRAKYKEVKQFLKNKKEDEPDNKDVLVLKGLIRRGEARIACEYNGVPKQKIHFLDLPFYETGRIIKKALTMADVQKILDVLHEIQPHQIFIAADLADPHGTHRICTDAVLAALDLERQADAEWLKDCRI